jgi:hypothetical protein
VEVELCRILRANVPPDARGSIPSISFAAS